MDRAHLSSLSEPGRREDSGGWRSGLAAWSLFGRAAGGSVASPILFWTVIGVIMLASLILRQGGATPDVSWLTSMCERILDGERGWVDIFETTPPAPTLLYMPGVILARLLGVSAEAGVFATAYSAVLLVLAFSVRLLPERISQSGPSRWTVIAPAAIFLFVLSNDAFAQREYFASAFCLPVFAVFIRRAQEGRWPALSDRIIAAAFAGLAFAIKPPIFALPFIAIAAFEAVRTRSLAFLFPSMLPVAAATGVIFTAASLALFPAYLDGVAQLMRDVYVPIRLGPQHGLSSRAFIGTAFCLAVSLVLAIRKRPPAASFALVFATTFLAIYFMQGKFFAYHVQPAALFALIALAILLWGEIAPLLSRPAANAAFAAAYGATVMIAALCFLSGFDDRRPQLHDLSWADGLDHPTALAISPDISIGFPLAEHLNARWVDRIHSQWVARYTRAALRRTNLSATERERYQRYHERDILRTRREIRDKAPELIIQCVAPSCSWLTEALLTDDPTLLDAYAPIAEEGAIRVLRRRDLGKEGIR